MLMSILGKFGLCAVPLGVILAILPLLLSDVESDYDQVQASCNKTLQNYQLQCTEISPELKELYRTSGVMVLRRVLPPELIADLVEEAQCRFQAKTATSKKWAFFARNVWMDSEAP